MRRLGKLAVVGSGPSGLYLLKHLVDGIDQISGSLDTMVIFEKSALAGYGMPYHPETTDRYNRANISSEELPELPRKFSEWLETRDRDELASWGIEKESISESEVYCRLALGEYFHEQFHTLADSLRKAGIDVDIRLSCAVDDIADLPDEDKLRISSGKGGDEDFDTVVIATGHRWLDDDRPEEGFYSSPWPVSKLFPEENRFLNHAIGTLGASLSAFDVISSLSPRHGDFVRIDGQLSFRSFLGAEKFELVMHTSEGWLPHLQWDQVEPFREIYRHVSRERMLALRGEDGFLRLGTYFDKVCRPALIHAFSEDDMSALVSQLRNEDFSIKEFVEEMSQRHEYVDSFEGMKLEFRKAKDSVENHRPIHWKETLDDLMYCLNYHAEFLVAEDQILFRKTVMPFLMNVIAAMPLQSAEMLLALHEAGKVRLVAGKVKIEGKGHESGTTRITVESGDNKQEIEYRTFVDCSGQKAMELGEFPFDALTDGGAVREARAKFLDKKASAKVDDDKLLIEDGETMLRTGGIDIDSAFRIVGIDGSSNPRIYDISFPHTSGVRPYSYGLQACNTTAGIVVRSWIDSVKIQHDADGNLEDVSESYASF